MEAARSRISASWHHGERSGASRTRRSQAGAWEPENYVLHPEQFVKDTRTNLKAGNPGAVLDGDLDLFIEEYLRRSIAKD
jgi:peptide chain release factor 2